MKLPDAARELLAECYSPTSTEAEPEPQNPSKNSQYVHSIPALEVQGQGSESASSQLSFLGELQVQRQSLFPQTKQQNKSAKKADSFLRKDT